MPKTPDGAEAAALLSIGDVAEATGISAETLRIWERRYGKPEAVRLPSGHRRYTDEDVRWLRRVAEALAHGHRPNKVVALDEKALDELLAPEDAPADHPDLAAQLEAVGELDGETLFESLRGHWDPDDYLAFLTDRVQPLVQTVGRAWADGDIEVRHEHFASELVEDLLRWLRTTYPLSLADPRVLLTTLSGETHGLGMQMAALICAARGVPTRVLGVNTPNDDIAAAARQLEVEIVGISISLATGGVETDRQLADLRSKLPKAMRLVVGGQGARGVRRGPRGIEYIESLDGWDEAMASLGE